MGMLRNKEIRQFVICFLVITAGILYIGYKFNPAAGILAAFSACMYGILFFLFTRDRYKKIAQISEEIDQILHDSERIYIADSEEGELSILKSEVTKMRSGSRTARLREKRSGLRNLWRTLPISFGRPLLLQI